MDSNVDSGGSGFLSIFGSANAEASDTPSPDSPETSPETDAAAAPDDATAADATSPDQELSAEDRVAARLAASLDEDGIDLSQTEDTENAQRPDDEHPLLADADAALDSLDGLTPEQIRAVAEEALALRQQVSVADKQVVAQKIAQAEHEAVAQVQAAYEREVLAVSAEHYRGIYHQRLARIVREAQAADNPEQVIVQQATLLADQVWQAKQQWEAEQTPGYDERAQAAALAARKQVPELRALYAAELCKQAGLPAAAAAELLKVRDTDDFVARKDELVAIRDALIKERQKNTQQQREAGNRRLAESTPRTSATGRAKAGKPPEYRGTADEGAHLLSMMHRR